MSNISLFSKLGSTAVNYKKNLNSQGLKNLQNTQLGDVAYSRLSNLADKFGLGGYLPQRQLGSFGKIVFVASSHTVRTFDALARNINARTASHEIIGQKPILEFLGPDTDDISFTMNFNKLLGVDPLKEIEEVSKMCREGQAEQLIINGKPFSEHKLLITSISAAMNTIDNRGNVLSASINVTLKEAPDIPKVVITPKQGGDTNAN